MAPRPDVPSTLREHRQAAGLTQAELAMRAGVSRQLVAAVEAGLNTPGVDAAMRLAHSLECKVEDLFTPAADEALPALGGTLPDGALVRSGRVGDRLVACQLADHGTAGAVWARPDGVFERGRLHLFPGTLPAGFVLAGCDPALGIAEAELGALGAGRLLALPASTGAALRALAQGRIHGAVVHGPEDGLPDPPVPVAAYQLARWEVGVAASPALADRELESLLQGEIPVVQRDQTAASQQALDRAAARRGLALPAGPVASGHIEAARTAAMLGAAAVTTESAAHAFGMCFHSLERHTVQIWIGREWEGHPTLALLGDLLAGTAFTSRVGRLGGYDLDGCGELI